MRPSVAVTAKARTPAGRYLCSSPIAMGARSLRAHRVAAVAAAARAPLVAGDPRALARWGVPGSDAFFCVQCLPTHPSSHAITAHLHPFSRKHPPPSLPYTLAHSSGRCLTIPRGHLDIPARHPSHWSSPRQGGRGGYPGGNGDHVQWWFLCRQRKRQLLHPR